MVTVRVRPEREGKREGDDGCRQGEGVGESKKRVIVTVTVTVTLTVRD